MSAVVLKTDKFTGRVLSANENGIEIEGRGRIPLAEDYKGYRLYRELTMCTFADLTFGYANADFIQENGAICGILLDVEIALFGCVFSVYSILLAFLSDNYVKKLLQIDYHGQTSYLRRSTRYYEAALFIYFVAIGLSLICKLIVECLPQNFILTNSDCLNEILAGLLLYVYFSYSLRAIYELKSIIGNTLLLFRASIQYKILAFQEDGQTETRDDELEMTKKNNYK